jgi:hypothetical protein
MATLNLDSIVDVVVEVSPMTAPRATFNQMLVVGSSTIISASERMRLYTGTADMLTDGFTSNSPEYKAALLYFAQSPAPDKLWVGRQDLTAPETCVEAVEACRAANFEWYTCMVCGAAKADHEAIALYIENATPSSVYCYTTQDADVVTNATDDIGSVLKGESYSRTIGQYTNVSTGDENAIAAIMGYAMGQNSGLANSAFTLKFKREVGILVEALSSTQISYAEGKNINLYLSYGNYYTILEQGVMANGQFFDEIIGLDMLKNQIQLNVMDLLYGNPKVPQTEDGVTQVMHAIAQACEQALTVGFLGPGTWTGDNILNLSTGDTLPKGYLVQAAKLSEQSDADRQARKSPSIYVAIKEAGAIHSVLIGVYVNR